MPTKTFLNLPENKKNKIKEASRREFERVLLSDASINKIIKDADISRGSFYTYFKDIDDLYIYILKEYQEKFYKIVQEAVKKTKGDILESTKIIYEKILKDCINKKIELKNIFLNINCNISIRTQLEYNEESKKKIIELTNKIDKTNLNIKTEEELLYIIDIIIGVVLHGLIEIFMDNKNEQYIKEKLDIQMQILKKGIYK